MTLFQVSPTMWVVLEHIVSFKIVPVNLQGTIRKIVITSAYQSELHIELNNPEFVIDKLCIAIAKLKTGEQIVEPQSSVDARHFADWLSSANGKPTSWDFKDGWCLVFDISSQAWVVVTPENTLQSNTKYAVFGDGVRAVYDAWRERWRSVTDPKEYE